MENIKIKFNGPKSHRKVSKLKTILSELISSGSVSLGSSVKSFSGVTSLSFEEIKIKLKDLGCTKINLY